MMNYVINYKSKKNNSVIHKNCYKIQLIIHPAFGNVRISSWLQQTNTLSTQKKNVRGLARLKKKSIYIRMHKKPPLHANRVWVTGARGTRDARARDPAKGLIVFRCRRSGRFFSNSQQNAVNQNKKSYTLCQCKCVFRVCKLPAAIFQTDLVNYFSAARQWR